MLGQLYRNVQATLLSSLYSERLTKVNLDFACSPFSLTSANAMPFTDVSDALIKNLNVKSHSSLGPHPKFSLDIPASPVMRQQSVVVNVPVSQSFVSLSLSIAPTSAQRRTKLVALFGPQRAPISPLPHSTPSELGYDIRLAAGLTKIEFQMVSLRGAGQEGVNGSGRVQEEKRDTERLTLFLRVIR